MAESQIDCCVSNCAQAEFIPNVNKSADAQPDYRVMTHVIKTSVDQTKMAETSDNECVGLTFVALEFGPRKLDANLGGNGMINANFLALIWTPTD